MEQSDPDDSSGGNPADWKTTLENSLSSPAEIAKRFNLNKKELEQVCEKYPAFINGYYLSLVKSVNDPIFKQCIPSSIELADQTGEEDPLCEEPEHQKRKDVPSLLTHRYPDRALFRISNVCSMYCRFCTRKRKVGDENKQPNEEEIEKALEYLRKHEEIRDVILSGGDPFMLSDEKLDSILSRVFEIISKRETGIIRIGTRVPCALPQRVTPNLCTILKKYHPLFINTHFNHPDEITPESTKACSLLADAGIPLGCQTVLLKGVNDDPEVMKKLVQKLVSIRVRPYYIYQADIVKGTNHFRTKVQKGLEIYKALRGFTSGLSVPTYVIDAPGGGGKIPILPEYMILLDDEKAVLRNYEGEEFVYKQN